MEGLFGGAGCAMDRKFAHDMTRIANALSTLAENSASDTPAYDHGVRDGRVTLAIKVKHALEQWEGNAHDQVRVVKEIVEEVAAITRG